ncbi:MAG: S8 family serine peptidase [Candidatus Sericytochromatia bacterium]|nr:S8 family serine peptidase [Candidatus Sericytochromatia bacterium]
MKKIIITLAALSLSACQSNVTPLQQSQMPAPLLAPSAAQGAQILPAASSTAPQRAALQNTVRSSQRASLSTGNTATPSDASAPATRDIQTPAPKMQLTDNYSTATLLAGLQMSATEADAQALAQKYNLGIENYLPQIRTVVFNTQGQNVPELLQKLAQEPVLEYVESDQVATQKPEREDAFEEGFQTVSNNPVSDSYFSQQYGLSQLRVTEAWTLSKGEDMIVAVIDTGTAFNHPDLGKNMVPGFDAFSNKTGKTGGDVSSLHHLMSSYKHGSHVAGIIAAETDNGRGIAGVAPAAKIMPISIFPSFSGWLKNLLKPADDVDQTIISILANGIIWAVDNGADVINMSLAVHQQSTTLERAVQYALDANVSVIVAAGNQRHQGNTRNELAAIDGVIAVGAVDKNAEVTFFSNSGDYLSVAGPGMDVLSTAPSFLGMNNYIKMTGTSMAAPHIAGVAALIKSKYGEAATPAFIKERLESTAIDKGEPGWDELYGHGLVDAYRALGGE